MLASHPQHGLSVFSICRSWFLGSGVDIDQKWIDDGPCDLGVHVANSVARCHFNLCKTFLSPTSTPRVLDDPVIARVRIIGAVRVPLCVDAGIISCGTSVGSRCVPAYENHSMVYSGWRALLLSDDTPTVVPESLAIGLESD